MREKTFVYLIVLIPLLLTGLVAFWSAYKHYLDIITRVNSNITVKKKSVSYFLVILTFGSIFSVWQFLTPFRKTFKEYGNNMNLWEIAVLTWHSRYFMNYVAIISMVILLIIFSTIFIFLQ